MRILFLISFLHIHFYSIAQFNSSNFRTVGSASALSDSCFQLTPAALGQSGSIWFQTPVDLREDFMVEGTINLGSLDSNGADGMAFVLQDRPDIIGGMGGGLGYQSVKPSLAIEFDTWQNDDPPFDHIALVKDGMLFHYIEPDFTLQGPFELLPSGANAEDGRPRSIKIEWDAGNMRLRCYYDGVLKIDHKIDIAKDIFNGKPIVYWGFTAATEGYFNEQIVCIKSKPPTICDKPKIHIPTAFTPNGDQLNDNFYPLSVDKNQVRFLRIFNRWGQIIFEKKNFPVNDKRYAWDGRFNGILQPAGLYTYMMVIDCSQGQPLEFKGTITLLR